MKEEDNKTNISCLELRENYEDKTTVTSSQSNHLESCSSCKQWTLEIDQLNQLAINAPQFEVAESLTQKILADVEVIENEERRKLTNWACCLAVAAFAWIVLVTDSLETVWGLASWVIGLATLLGLKYLVQEPSNQLNTSKATGTTN